MRWDKLIRQGCASGAFLVVGALAAQAATLTVEATGAEGNAGQVYVGICNKSFEEADCNLGQRQLAKAGPIRFAFRDLRPGRYAVAAYHDLNGNGRLDKQSFGLPAEPYGFSNDVGRFAPPSFDRALVEVAEPGTTVSIRLKRISLTP